MRLTESYMSSLKVFASMTGTEGKNSDQELRNRWDSSSIIFIRYLIHVLALVSLD
jgi:hypothetical protein